MGQNGPLFGAPPLPRPAVSPYRRPALLGLVVVGVLAAAVAQVLLARPGAATSTRLASTTGASIMDVTGRSRPAHAGDLVAPGETVQVDTAPDATAELDTGGRRVQLASGTAYVVLDGIRAVLRNGAAYLDLRRGPTLDLMVDRVRLLAEGGQARAERGITDRIAVYRGGVRLQAASGRSVPITELRQVLASGEAVPGVARDPMALVRDAWDARARPDVLALDASMTALATGLDTGPTGMTIAARLPAGEVVASPREAGERPSESVLALAVARAASTGQPVSRVYAEVRAGRRTGGSWGVVAQLVGASADRVGAAVSGLVDTPAGGGLGRAAELTSGAGSRVPGAAPAGAQPSVVAPPRPAPAASTARPVASGSPPSSSSPPGRPILPPGLPGIPSGLPSMLPTALPMLSGRPAAPTGDLRPLSEVLGGA